METLLEMLDKMSVALCVYLMYGSWFLCIGLIDILTKWGDR